jgi:hypothetical protein
MKSRKSEFFLVLAAVCLIALDAGGGSPTPPPELIGTWSYTSLTALKNGRPFGTAHIKPGQLKMTFNPDGTWILHPTSANPQGLNGSYEIHGRDLEMKFADGKPYDKCRFKFEQDGKVLVLTGAEQIITAIRE